MGIFSKKLRPTRTEEKEIFEDCFNDSLIGPQRQNEELFEGFNYSDGPDESFEEGEDLVEAEDELSTGTEVVLSDYQNYRLIEVNEDDEVYYLVMAPDGSVITEDFYAWAESEGIDFDVLPTSDKVARFADYVDSIRMK